MKSWNQDAALQKMKRMQTKLYVNLPFAQSGGISDAQSHS